MIAITKILVNYLENPIGIDKVEQIGWKITSDNRNVYQISYHLQISEDEKFKNIFFDSGIIKEENSFHVSGKEITQYLKSSTKYHVRVQIDTTEGKTEWKESFFVTALCKNDEWNASFITIETEEDKNRSRGTYLRNKVNLLDNVRAAYVHTTALGLYHFYINGERIGNDEFSPGWTSYNKHLLYQTYDVTEYLQKGENTLACLLGAGWYKGDMGFLRTRNNYGMRAAFACQLIVYYENGDKETICTNTDWIGHNSPILFSEIYDGEIYDARLEIDYWNDNRCDQRGWKNTTIVHFDTQVLAAQAGAKVKEVTRILAKQILKTPQGDTVIDFGQNLTGWVTFKVKGKEGKKVELNCFEVLDREGNAYFDNLRTAKQTVIYICKDDKEVIFHENFSFQGFQYVRIKEYPSEVKLENFVAYAVHSDMKITGFIECSNEDVNQLHRNIVWGMKGNFLDIPTDCPQRDERLGWTGDAQIFCRTATYLMDAYTFYRKWLVDVKAEQTAEGGIPHVVPDLLIGRGASDWLLGQGEHSAAAWADVIVIAPWTMYLMYGDTSILEEQYDSMKSWINFMHEHADGNIWNYKLQFGDWVALDAEEGSYFGATPNDLTCTAYYAYSTGLFVKISKILGKNDDYLKYNQLYQSIVKTYQETFFENGRLNVQTQTAQIVSLYFGLVPEEYKENVVSDLLKLLEKENGHLVTGFVGTPYFCHALSQNGHTKEAYDLLFKDDFPSWLYQVKQGATTIWEHWDGKKPDGTMWSADMNSFNHYAYGAVGEWLYRVAAGIEVDELKPGFKHIIIRPHINEKMDYLKGKYESIYGIIRSEWSKKEDCVMLNVEIPCNTSASILLEDVSQILEVDGVCFEKKAEKVWKAKVGSGKYKFVYKI